MIENCLLDQANSKLTTSKNIIVNNSKRFAISQVVEELICFLQNRYITFHIMQK